MHQTYLSAEQKFLLQALVRGEYTSSALGDKAFAGYAEKKLGFPITNFQIRRARHIFKIPLNQISTLSKKLVELQEELKQAQAEQTAMKEST